MWTSLDTAIVTTAAIIVGWIIKIEVGLRGKLSVERHEEICSQGRELLRKALKDDIDAVVKRNDEDRALSRQDMQSIATRFDAMHVSLAQLQTDVAVIRTQLVQQFAVRRAVDDR